MCACFKGRYALSVPRQRRSSGLIIARGGRRVSLRSAGDAFLEGYLRAVLDAIVGRLCALRFVAGAALGSSSELDSKPLSYASQRSRRAPQSSFGSAYSALSSSSYFLIFRLRVPMLSFVLSAVLRRSRNSFSVFPAMVVIDCVRRAAPFLALEDVAALVSAPAAVSIATMACAAAGVWVGAVTRTVLSEDRSEAIFDVASTWGILASRLGACRSGVVVVHDAVRRIRDQEKLRRGRVFSVSIESGHLQQ
ncbi:hypothetical protein B0H19DRAFT_1109722 [Mycena capillaripes]|nr:hypothetical protein B0H19DRAFT_1109722 [Mycena capillaripes]